MRIAILYICTGRYNIFWKDFYRSCEKYFINNAVKTYYVFTDAETVYNEDDNSVKKIYQENLGWPGNTLFRFRIFSKCIDELKDYDYVFFFNANMLFVKEVSENILSNDALIVTEHPGKWKRKRKHFTYETNSESLAYISENQGDVYVCGGLNGGTGEIYTKMIRDLEESIDKDYERGIIAKWHDESHLNKYILTHNYKLLDAGYACPEGFESKLPFDCKVVIRDKEKYGGHAFLRQESNIMVEKKEQPKVYNCWRNLLSNMKKIIFG